MNVSFCVKRPYRLVDVNEVRYAETLGDPRCADWTPTLDVLRSMIVYEAATLPGGCPASDASVLLKECDPVACVDQNMCGGKPADACADDCY